MSGNIQVIIDDRTLIINLIYLVSIVLFIFGIKFLSSAKTARRGNMFSATAMLIAVGAVLLEKSVLSFDMILLGIVIGAAIGLLFAYRVQMTQMPEMVALFNGFGGAASALVALSEFFHQGGAQGQVEAYSASVISLSILIGGVTLTGSLVAFGKLSGILPGQPVVYPLQKAVNALFVLALLGSAVLLAGGPDLAARLPTGWGLGGDFPGGAILLVLTALSLILGITMVIPIGGGDMPVVISLLNSYSGLAAAATGFVLNNYALILAGALVGASGIILTVIMCNAMNRSLANVLFGAFGTVDVQTGGGKTDRPPVKKYLVDDALIQLENADSVIVVPGYGLAVAQAQHILRDLADMLEAQGTTVNYAIHPVAGRMPGHMNVLLAEADVDYDQLKDLESINSEFENTDVVLVVGANDVINPAARQEGSPIFGMPILDVDKARTVIVLKRSMSPGYAGIDNDLFYEEKTMMVFGNAKESLTEMVSQFSTED